MLEVAEQHPEVFVRNFRGLIALRNVTVKPRSEMPEVFFIYGPPGSGKTRFAFEFLGDPGLVWFAPPTRDGSSGSPLWFDGLDTVHKVCVFDEFTGSTMPRSLLLRICDRYPLQLQTKGGMVNFNVPTIFFIANQPPKYWYKSWTEKGIDAALLRRVKEIRYMGDGTYPTSETWERSEAFRTLAPSWYKPPPVELPGYSAVGNFVASSF